ncbi:MAG TPA: CAP domain-containing protein [Gaiellaceae bacterium]
MVGKKLAPVAAALALIASIAAPAGARVSGPEQKARANAVLATQVLVDVNRLRRAHGLAPLRLSPSLAAAAKQHSQEMARLGYFSHDSADGAAFWRRVQRYYGPNGHQYWSVGENLLWSSPDIDAAGSLKMWMASPEHRANLLKPEWREIGLSAVHADAAPGTFRGLEVTIVTADFGVRR